MEIKRPLHERFDISFEESMAFWLQIIRDYTHSEVRSKSLLVYKNNPLVRTDEDA